MDIEVEGTLDPSERTLPLICRTTIGNFPTGRSAKAALIDARSTCRGR
jgi:hypothetical protein